VTQMPDFLIAPLAFLAVFGVIALIRAIRA